VEEVRPLPHDEMEVAGVVLAELEGLETVGDEGLVEGSQLSESLLEEEAVSADSLALSLNGGGGDVEGACDLAEAGAGDGAVEDLGEEVGALEPVGGAEGLFTEGDAA